MKPAATDAAATVSPIARSAADDILESWLDLPNLERGSLPEGLKLDRMERLCAAAENPERSFKSIHVAGSKGKGSTSAYIAAALSARGHKVGLFASPHVASWSERVSLSGRPFADGIYRSADAATRAAVAAALGDRGESPTFFEVCTLFAFLCYREARCDWAVVETGIGGRLDCTNVVDPELSVITQIELEHAAILGDSVQRIAYEKAGIIKRGRPAVVGHGMDTLALEVMRARARETASPLREADACLSIRDFRDGFDGATFTLAPCGPPAFAAFREEGASAFRADLSMHGSHQAANASLALLAMIVLRENGALGPSSAKRDGQGFISRCIAAFSPVSLPARFEILSSIPLVAVDGAHTPASFSFAARLFESLRGGQAAEGAPAGKRRALLLFACASDKNPEDMAQQARGIFPRVIVTRPGDFKQSEPERAARAFRQAGMAVEAEADWDRAFGEARAWIQGGGDVLVAGSFYLAALARAALAAPAFMIPPTATPRGG